MARSPAFTSVLIAALAAALAGCHGSADIDTDAGSVIDGGPDSGYVTPVDVEDAGPVTHDPDIATSFGPFTGAYDINGVGELFAIQVDGHLAIQLNDPSQTYLGSIDGGAFQTEIVYPELETCGALTVDGTYKEDAGYKATQVFCAAGTFASGPLAGQRFATPNIYRQNIAWSGVYDLTEKPSAGNDCTFIAPTAKLSVGVARDRDGGSATVALFDTQNPELVYGGVDDTSGILRAHAVDSAGNDTDSFSLFFLVDGGVSGTRELQLVDSNDNPCTGELSLTGTKR